MSVTSNIDVHQVIESKVDGYEIVRKKVLAIPNANDGCWVDVVEVCQRANGLAYKEIVGHVHVSLFSNACTPVACFELYSGKIVELILLAKKGDES